ncbi:penicillin-binding protein 2 [soil metagenome]
MNYRSQPLAKLEHYSRNRLLLCSFLAIGLLLGAAQLINLTVIQHSAYTKQAANNLFAQRRLSSPRGNIFDRNGEALATNRKTYSVSFNPYGLKDAPARESLKKVQTIFGAPTDVEIEEILSAKPRTAWHRIARQVEPEVVLPILEQPTDFPGVRWEDDFKREYTHPVSMSLVLGTVSKIAPDEKDVYTRPRYLPDDEVGRSGLEKSREDDLAGQPGIERLEQTARARDTAKSEILQQAFPGKDIHLTIDAALQEKAMSLLAGETGSIVVMDVNSGEVLVMASNPTFSAIDPAAREVNGLPPGFLNRCIRGTFPPGSCFKIVSAAAALKNGVSPLEKTICTGSVKVGGWSRPFYCDARSGHGALNMTQAIQMSCNVYFYELSAKLGPAPIHDMSEVFGFGLPTGVDLSGEQRGNVPTIEQLSPGENTIFAIGQGKLLATPLQVTRAFAALANGGTLVTPHIVSATGNGGELTKSETGPTTATGVPQHDIDIIVEGLARVVSQPGGTAYKVGFPRDWEVVGKTATAENAQKGIDAWFSGFFPRSRPQYAFAVQIESADGHGGDIAGPIAKAIIGDIMNPPPAAEIAKANSPSTSPVISPE